MAAVSVAYMAFVFLMSSIPDDGNAPGRIFTQISPAVQNMLHLPVFGLLAVLWLITLRLWGVRVRTASVVAVAITVVFGGSDEVHQYFVPGRIMSLSDFILDGIGAWGGVILHKQLAAGEKNA